MDYEVRVVKEYTGYLISVDLTKVSVKAFPELIERAWGVVKLVNDFLPGSLMTGGYGDKHCGLRITMSDEQVRKLTGSKSELLADDLLDFLKRNGDRLQKIAKYVEDKLNE